ncbi:MAG: ribosome assembly RNA-binding protein YhbY [Tissierellia bacterium]|nr:ribosome assembly RNA-binding protein YhbY [Tissierellia bacterium]
MINAKQRKHLKSIANTLEPKINVGKNSISDNVIAQIDQILEANEIVKIKVLNNNLDDQDEMVQVLLEKLNAEFISHVGSKITLYRKSDNKLIDLPR